MKNLEIFRKPIIEGLNNISGWDIKKANQEYQFFTLLAKSATKSGNKILACSPESVVQCILSLVHLDLSLNPALNQSYLIARGGECTLTIGYQGQIDHLSKEGVIKYAIVGCVREGDKFSFSRGSEGIKWFHSKSDKPGKITSAYCIYVLPDGSQVGDNHPYVDIDKRRRSAKTQMVWNAWPEEMAMAKACRMSRKGLPNHRAVVALDQIDNMNYNLNPEFIDAERIEIIREKFGKITKKRQLDGAYDFLNQYEQAHPEVQAIYDSTEKRIGEQKQLQA